MFGIGDEVWILEARRYPWPVRIRGIRGRACRRRKALLGGLKRSAALVFHSATEYNGREEERNRGVYP